MSFHRCVLHLLTVCLAGLLITVAKADEQWLRFGFYATERPSEEMRKLEPLRRALEGELAGGRPAYRVEIFVFPTYEEGLAAILEGRVDVARLGAASYLLAKQRLPGLPILAVETHAGRKTVDGLIFVPAAAPVRALAELRGRRVAFGDPNSTSGRYLPQAELLAAGLRARDLARIDYLGRHDRVVRAVLQGGYDAGVATRLVVDKYASPSSLRVIARFTAPTPAWVARESLDERTVRRLREVLLKIGPEALATLDRDGFLPGKDSDYDELRRAMQSARDFGG